VYALQIPFQSLKDDEVNKYYSKFRQIQTLKTFVYLPAFVYMLSTPITSTSSANTMLALFGAGLVADITFNNIAHHQMGKAVELYNISIMQHSAIGLELQKTNKDTALCIGFRMKL
jgi:hypothetical protein